MLNPRWHHTFLLALSLTSNKQTALLTTRIALITNVYMCIVLPRIGPVSDQPVRNLELIIFFSGKNEKCSEWLEMQNKHLMYF